MEQINDELVFSEEALAVRPILYDVPNSIVLLVEDANKEYEYEVIFKRLLGEKYCFTNVFGLGGKDAVKRYYNENGCGTNGGKNFYLVDGDFDRYVRPEDMIDSPCFLYLNAYNIENYFIDENACIKYAQGIMHKMEAEVKNTVDFLMWKQEIVNQSKQLFLCYCYIQKYFPEIPNVSRQYGEFLDSKTGFERTDTEYSPYLNIVLDLDPSAQEKIDEIADIYQGVNGNDYFNLICGKFLLKSLYWYLQSVLPKKKRGNCIEDDFRWQLINHFDISRLAYVRDKIEAITN